MIRHGRWKYVYYVHYPEQPQLFDLEADPEELRDLGTDPAHAAVRRECEARLRALLDPEEVDRRAKKRQAEIVAANGGREAVIRRGSFAYSPPPGFKAEFASEGA
jgi:choline-sulfatase